MQKKLKTKNLFLDCFSVIILINSLLLKNNIIQCRISSYSLKKLVENLKMILFLPFVHHSPARSPGLAAICEFCVLPADLCEAEADQGWFIMYRCFLTELPPVPLLLITFTMSDILSSYEKTDKVFPVISLWNAKQDTF